MSSPSNEPHSVWEAIVTIVALLGTAAGAAFARVWVKRRRLKEAKAEARKSRDSLTSFKQAQSSHGIDMILIVDDETNMLIIMAKALAMLPDVNISTARTIEDAMELLSQREFALVFLDLRVGGDNGWSLKEHCRRARIVLITGAMDQVALEAIALEDNVACLAKPFTIEELVAVAKEQLALR